MVIKLSSDQTYLLASGSEYIYHFLLKINTTDGAIMKNYSNYAEDYWDIDMSMQGDLVLIISNSGSFYLINSTSFA